MRGGEDFSRNMIFDCPDQCAFAIGRAEDGFEEKRSCAFPVGACDAGERQPLGGALKKIGAQSCECPASVLHLGPSHSFARSLTRRIADDCHRTGGDGLIDERISIARLTPHGDEGIAGLYSPRVVFQAADARITALGEDFRAVQKLKEIHWNSIVSLLQFNVLNLEGSRLTLWTRERVSFSAAKLYRHPRSRRDMRSRHRSLITC